MLHLGSKKNMILCNYLYTLLTFRKRRIMAKEIAKNLLPSLHNKTHFMAAESLYNNCPGIY